MLPFELYDRCKVPMTRYLFLFTMLFLIACGDSASESVSPPLVEPPLVEPPLVEPPLVEPPVVEPPVVEPPVVEPQKVVVNEHFPLNHENNVSLNPTIEISFDKEIDTKADIELTLSQGDKIIEGEVVINHKQLIFKPGIKLEPEKKYTISLRSSPSAKSTIDLVEWDFTTTQQNNDLHVPYFPSVKTKGTTKFSLEPIETVKSDQTVRVSFGIPFPKGFLTDLSLFKIIDSDGVEVPISAKNTLLWQSDKSIRAVQVQLDVTFSFDQYNQLLAKDFLLIWGEKRNTSDVVPVNVKETWTLVDDSNFSADLSIYEPKAYAVFQSEWYGKSVIKNRLLPFYTNDTFSANDIAFKLFGDTAINHVDPRVRDENLIPFKTSYASWLFDRAMTLYQLAFKSGEFKYLRAAHRASQFYLQHINEKGFFSLKPSNDSKYSYGESLLANYILTGDERIPATIERMIPAWDSFHTEYTLKSNFWTERHAAYQLLGYIIAYEVFGTDELENKVINTFSILRKMQVEPAEGVPITGALMHTSGSHGEGGGHFIASPWMSTILIGAIERYYANFDDEIAIDFIMKMADFFAQDEVSLSEWKGYTGTESYTVPYYLAGEGLTVAQHGGTGLSALEHAHDVSKIFTFAYYLSCKTECNEKYLEVISRLNNSVVTFGFPYWIRTSAPAAGLASFRLSPPRKFSWWFQHSANNNFLLGDSIKLPFYKPKAPYLSVQQSHNAVGSVKPNDEVTFTYSIENLNSKVAKNVVVVTRTLERSPNKLLDIIAMDKLAIDRGDSVAWKFDKIEPNTGIYGLSFTVKVKDLPAFQSKSRPIGDIVSYVGVYYCDEEDDDSICKLPESPYELGTQTVHTQSNWQLIDVIKPITPPSVSLSNLIEDDVLDGLVNLSAQVEDSDGIDHVDFYLNGVLVESMRAEPFEYALQANALSIEKHTLTVKAWDIYGSEGVKSVTFSVRSPDVTMPVVDIQSPLINSVFCDDVLLQYSINDTYSIKSCELSLNQEIKKLGQCVDYTIPRITSLFSASAILSLENNGEIKSSDEYALIGEGTSIEVTDGYIGNALLFGGEGSFVDFTQTRLDIENDITVSFWINPSADESVIISQDWYYIGVERGWAISLGANNHENNNPLAIAWSSGNNSQNLNNRNVVQTPANSISLDTWQHVVVRKNSTLVDIFIDGQLVQSQQVADGHIGWPFNSDKILSLGKAMKHPTMYQKNYKGALDELAIWNKAISDSAIQQLFSRSSSEGIQNITVTAIDGAGNRGSASVEFEFESCL